MNFDLIVIIIASYLVGVFTTKMRAKCALSNEITVDNCPYSDKNPR